MMDSFIEKFGGITEEYKFYNDEITLRYDTAKHVYLLETPDGLEELPSVTTIVHILDKSPALINWACKMMEIKLLGLIDPITTLKSTWTYEEIAGFAHQAKSAHKDKLEEAGEVGATAHGWIEQLIKWELVNPTSSAVFPNELPTDEKAANCCKAALSWMRKHNVRWICTERKIYSCNYKYAGTMDGLAIVDSCDDVLCCPKLFKDVKSLIDWKSSNNLYLEYILQISAYLYAYEEETGEAVQDRWIIRLGKEDGKFEPLHLYNDNIKTDIETFLLCLNLMRHVKEIDERLKEKKALAKESMKNQAKAEKAEQLKIKCKLADKYKGLHQPKCNEGNPCETCVSIYANRHGLTIQQVHDILKLNE